MNARHLRSARLLLPLFFALSVLTLLPTFARADILTDMKNGVGAALGTTTDNGGYIIGLFLVVVVSVGLALLTGKMNLGYAGAFFGTVAVILLGFWPVWVGILIVLGLVVILVFVPGSRSNSGA